MGIVISVLGRVKEEGEDSLALLVWAACGTKALLEATRARVTVSFIMTMICNSLYMSSTESVVIFGDSKLYDVL